MASQRICFISLHSYGYFVDGYGVTGGGAERQVSLLARELSDEFDTHVIVGDYGQPATVTRDGVVLHRAYTPHDAPSATERITWLRALNMAMDAADADLYIHRGTPGFASIVWALTSLRGTPWVYNIANDANITDRPDALGAVRRRLFERGLTNAASIIAQTPKQASLLAERYGLRAEIVPNGYPQCDEVTQHSERDDVVWVGRLDPEQKRPHLVTDIAASLPHIQFTLVGPPSDDHAYQQEIEDRIDQLPNVEYVGSVPPNEVHEYYRSAYCVLSTSAYEGFPNTFLEAWRVGTPVVSLDVDPARIAQQHSVGSFADGDLTAAADMISQLVTDPDCWRTESETARAVFEAKFDIASVATAYASVLTRCLSNTSTRNRRSPKTMSQ